MRGPQAWCPVLIYHERVGTQCQRRETFQASGSRLSPQTRVPSDGPGPSPALPQPGGLSPWLGPGAGPVGSWPGGRTAEFGSPARPSPCIAWRVSPTQGCHRHLTVLMGHMEVSGLHSWSHTHVPILCHPNIGIHTHSHTPTQVHTHAHMHIHAHTLTQVRTQRLRPTVPSIGHCCHFSERSQSHPQRPRMVH